MNEEKPLSLRERIAAETKRRKKEKEIDEATFGIDKSEVLTETTEATDLVITFDRKAFPLHSKICDLAESMGMELKKIAEDGSHAFNLKQYILYVNAGIETVELIEVYQGTGNTSSLMLKVVELNEMEAIEQTLAEILFLKMDIGREEKLEIVKRSWNRKYSKEHGEWL